MKSYDKIKFEELQMLSMTDTLTINKLYNNDRQDSPQTAEEFERKVMASPNDSSLWIRLIALHLKQLEVDKARQVSKRALKTIHG